MSAVLPQKRRKAYSYIRMSTDAQLKGDSLRRQLTKSQRYIVENNLELVEDLRDLGVSAFRGANVEHGALGQFIQAVRNGHIDAGSYLIVEAFDRISRQPARIALQLILELINSGITVVTLAKGQVYSSENYDTQQLIISIIEMTTAAEESLNKSERITEARETARSLIHVKKITSRGPAWLEYSVETKQFEFIPSRVAVVRRIFDEAIIGIGAGTIARRLNEDRVLPFGSSAKWKPSSVNKILVNPAVVGDFQLHKREERVRVRVGEPIKGYFPAVISDDIYASAKGARSGRKTTGGGRRGKYFSNIFTKLIYCNYCGSRMLFENKGEGPKGGTYLVCTSIPTGSNCVRTRWRYNDFEASFLAFVQQIDLGSIFTADRDAAKRTLMEAEIAALSGHLLLLKQKRDKVFEVSLHDNMDDTYIAAKLQEFKAQIVKQENKLVALQDTASQMSYSAAKFYESRDQIKDLIDRVKLKSEDNYKTRAQIASRLKSLIDRIDVASVGQSPSNLRIANFLVRIRDDETSDLAQREQAGEVETLHKHLIGENENLRFFSVKFKDGTTQFVWPSADDPLQFEQRMAPVYEIAGERVQVIP